MEIQWINYLIYVFFSDLIVGWGFEPIIFLLKTTKCVSWVIFFIIIILVRILNATTRIPLKYMSVWSNNYNGISFSHIYGGIYYNIKNKKKIKKEAPFYYALRILKKFLSVWEVNTNIHPFKI